MNRTITVVLVATLILATNASADPVGLWRSAPSDRGDHPGGYVIVDIQPCKDAPDSLCGTIVKALDAKDREGSPELVGKLMLKNLKPSGPSKWVKGSIWAPDEDKTYHSKITEQKDGNLKVYGCLLRGILCRGQVWTRVSQNQ